MNKQQIITKKELSQSFWAYVKRQYSKNKVAVVSLYFVYLLVFTGVFADFLANEKPIVAIYNGVTYFPILKEYAVKLGIGEWQEQYRNVKWKDLYFDFALWPPVPYLPQNLDFDNAQSVGPFDEQVVKSLRWKHWLGTDELGRDVMAGMIHGTRIALLVGVISMGIATLIGIILGSLAGYFGDEKLKVSRSKIIMNILFVFLSLFYGFGLRAYVLEDAIGVSFSLFLIELLISLVIIIAIIAMGNLLAIPLKKLPYVGKYLGKKVFLPLDMIISRLIEIIVSIPRLFLIISIVAIAKPSIFLVMTVIGLTTWTGIARFIRAELLKVRSLEYIEAANALGFSNVRALMKHAIPNAMSPVFIAIAFGIASAILIESTLSFLGIGVSADTVTWGSLLATARQAPQAWWLAIFPGFAIFITVTIFNLVGEGLTDALDPRQKQ